MVTSANVRNKISKQNVNIAVPVKKKKKKEEEEVPEGMVDDSALGDISQKNAINDGLSDLARVRRGMEKRGE